MKIIILLFPLFSIPLAMADTTFFENPNEFFIMSTLPIVTSSSGGISKVPIEAKEINISISKRELPKKEPFNYFLWIILILLIIVFTKRHKNKFSWR